MEDALTEDEKRVIDLATNTFEMYGGKIWEKIAKKGFRGWKREENMETAFPPTIFCRGKKL